MQRQNLRSEKSNSMCWPVAVSRQKPAEFSSSMSALCLNRCTLQIGREHSAATLAPFAAPAGGLNPSGTHTIADLSRGNVGSHGHDLADRLRTEGLGGRAGGGSG